MNISKRNQLDERFQTLLGQKFGDLLAWKNPGVEKTVGPFTPEVFDTFEAQRDFLVDEVQTVLQSLSNADVALLLVENLDDPDGKRDSWSDFLANEIRVLNRRKPSWLAGGFGHPDYQADFDYWGKMEKFDLHEAMLLSVGVEPKHIGEKRLSEAKKVMEKEALVAPLEFLVRRHEQFIRKFPSGSFGTARVSPSSLINWFDEVSMEVHPEFMSVLRARLKRRVYGTSATSEPSKMKTDRREVDKIAQLFTAMAIDNLGYQPKAKRSPVPKEITDLAADMGLDVSDDTVRKYLKLGAKFIPDDWEPK